MDHAKASALRSQNLERKEVQEARRARPEIPVLLDSPKEQIKFDDD
jgi:hypothetical protein